MQGKIQSVEQRVSSNKKQPFLVVTMDDGQEYSVWDEPLFDKFKQGLQIDFQFRKSRTGNFLNITNVQIVGKVAKEKPEKTMEERLKDLETRVDDLEDEIEELKK